jgi:hypothetical protein
VVSSVVQDYQELELEFVLRLTVSRPVHLGIEPPLGLMTRFYLSFLFLFDNYFIVVHRAPSRMRGQVCSLQCNRWLVRSLTTNNHTLPSHLRLCSLFVASYDSQGFLSRLRLVLHDRPNRVHPNPHMRMETDPVSKTLCSFVF